jgi:hypothetical protein
MPAASPMICTAFQLVLDRFIGHKMFVPNRIENAAAAGKTNAK